MIPLYYYYNYHYYITPNLPYDSLIIIIIIIIILRPISLLALSLLTLPRPILQAIAADVAGVVGALPRLRKYIFS